MPTTSPTTGDTSPGPTPSFASESDFTSNSMIETPCPANNKTTIRDDTAHQDTPNMAEQEETPQTILVPATGPRTIAERRMQNSLVMNRGRFLAARATIEELRAESEKFEAEQAKEAGTKEEGQTQVPAKCGSGSTGDAEGFDIGLKKVAFLLVAFALAYMWWNWYTSPEMEYVRRRQREVYGL